MKTGIIIPCYNEEKRLNVAAFKKFIAQTNDFHLCFVNDGSKDDTISVLKDIQFSNPNKVSIIDMRKNSGKAAAVRAGARYLHSRGDITYIGFIDADLSTDFEDFNDLLKTLKTNKKLSMVFGSRAKNATSSIQKNSCRGLISKCINILIVLILGLSIKDTQCGAKVFKAELVPIVFNKSFLSKWLFDVEMFIKMKRHFGKAVIMTKIHEQPLSRWIHVEDSKLGLKDAIEIPFRLISIWFNYNIVQQINMLQTDQNTEPALDIFNPVTTVTV
ncbi:dolichyl-phosphate beta-glucosyltransferase [Aquimarina algicola]|uniref:dolichyl-phosphate beta-glucosyltransferase n=1 Tax=Aquimarina algicola TaxID=2589995 RepID=A0A504JK54_9FLAO|nr:dolichyl-phosphate beta-glucosyltransferase [Aquimarina algicola]TPN86920.1 glycosyltransferase family 2 protein [Aquimarina algicola]